MDTTKMIILTVGGLVVFLVVFLLALGPVKLNRASRYARMFTYSMLYTDPDPEPEPERPWVGRARVALASLPPPPRRSEELAGWSWRPVDRDPTMTVHVDDHSSDGRRVSGHIVGTPGTLAVSCKARTELQLCEGWITLTPDGSNPMTLRAGDSLVLQPGFSGGWENETVVHLNYGVTLY